MASPLRATSLMSDNEGFIFLAITSYIEDQLNLRMQVVDDVDWQKREKLLDEGQIEIAWLCGLPYTLRADRPAPEIELLAAPVMAGNRYQNRPVYFSDVIVYHDSGFKTFADLRGAAWAYNEPYSHSGYNVVRYHLATSGEKSGYFGEVVQSGAHLASVQMVLDRRVDASAIDSIVLEIESQRRPELLSQLRVIETLGPSSVPPLVISRKVPQEIRQTIREALVKMDGNPSGQAALAKGRMVRLARVKDSDYDDIRYMAQKANGVKL